MDTLFVIIFVFIMKLLTYFLPEVITGLMLIIIIGFFLSFKKSSEKKRKSNQENSIRDTYMRFGQFMEEDDKRRGGGAW